MPRIQANRDAVDDRFSVLGFTVRSESPLFEVGVATDPQLFRAERKADRSRRNFFSSRAAGVLRARRGEAVYLLPPDVLSNFVGQPKLYFGLATYRDNSKGTPDHVQAPSAGNMYVSLAGLTERGLRRLATGTHSSSYGQVNGRDPSLEWGGDAWPQQPAAATNGGASATPPNVVAPPTPPAPYDDGFGTFPAASTAPEPGATAAAPAVTAQALRRAPQRHARPFGGDVVVVDEDDARGIEGPIPDTEPGAAPSTAQALDAPAPEYPQASRFVAAASENFRAMSSPRTIERIVLHITDGGANIEGTIAWFRNPKAQVSAHYVIGRDGEVVQMVRHNDKAWHARSANTKSIGIEHVANTRGLPPTGAQLCASAALVTWLCDQYGIAADREHIVGHAEADPQTTHTGCPNAVWNWEHYMQMIDTRSCIEPAAAIAQSLGARRAALVRPDRARPMAQAQEIITPFYDPADPASALTCQDDAFSQAREEWFVGVGNTRMFPHSAIVKLTMTGPDGSRYGGTGFYIGRKRILTCAHNLHGMSNVVIEPGSNAAGDAPFGRATVQSAGWRIAPGYSGSGDWAHDLAVIDNAPIAAPNGQWFSFLQATPSDRMPLVVCGYSAQSDAVPALTQAIDGERQHLHGGYASEQPDAETIEYAILTLKGASGSPVYHLSRSSGTLEALITAVHVTGQPAAQGRNGGCFITPQKIDWIEGRTSAFALRAPARTLASTSIHWDDVPYYPQSSPKSCWAASAAMVVGWRDRMSIPDTEIARMVPVIDAYRTGLWPSDRRQLADAWGLVAEPPASYTIEAWAQMLEAYGPLYIDMTWSGASGGHVRVLVGMESDGNVDGSGTTMYMHDPWPDTPGRIKLPFADFLELYERRTDNSGGQLLYQILHAERIPDGVAPVTAAPFALTLASEAEPTPAPAATKNGNGIAAAPAPIAAAPKTDARGLPQPPAPIVQQQSLRARAGALAAEVIEVASPIAGTTLKRVRDNDGGVIFWDLDQLEGMKHPDGAAPAIASTLQDGPTLLYDQWPYLDGEDGQRIRMDLEVRWQYDGSAVGNIRMSRHGAAASAGHRLEVSARVADVAGRFPSDNPVCAAIDINVEYRFTRADASVVVAVYALRLFGNGRHNCAGRWLDA